MKKHQETDRPPGLRTIIAGSRSIADPELLRQAVAACGWRIRLVVSGTARGVDRLGEQWAAQHGIPVERFPAEWERYGRSAGFRRNAEMARHADALIALWDGRSRGTRHMIEVAERAGLRVHIVQSRQTT